jgi:ribosomal protein S18 acetylase RimI-like enzyme
MEAGGDTLWLEDLYIRKDFRNKGLGKEYFNFIFSEYKGVRRFRLEVEDTNERAVKLYKSLGFEFLEYKQMILDKF